MSDQEPPTPGGLRDLAPLRDDGLPTLETGEPVLARWFVIAMLVLVPVAIAVTVWGILSIPRDELPAAERRPPGDETVTTDRGQAEFGETLEVEPGPACASGIRLVGDEGVRDVAATIVEAACAQIAELDLPLAEQGLRAWSRSGGQLRIGAFERTGVESSTRVQTTSTGSDEVTDRLIVELNAKFQFTADTAGAPALIHQLAVLGEGSFPGEPVPASAALAAAREQSRSCAALPDQAADPRGCSDVDELLALDDPRAALVDAGYPTE